MLKKLLLIIGLTLNTGLVEPNEPLKTSAFLSNPDSFYLLEETRILVSDPTAEFPLYILDIEDDRILYKVRNGRGPGELGNAYHTITFLNNNKIAVFDREQLRMNLYDYELTFLNSVELVNENLFQAGILSNKSAFIMPSSHDAFHIHSYDKNKSRISRDPDLKIGHADTESLKGLENFLLKQDVHFASDPSSGELFVSFRYSSLIMKIDESGTVFENLEPTNYSFPEAEPREGRIYSLPEIDVYPVGALDIEFDKNYIYVLYSGEKMSSGLLSRFRNPDSIVEQITHSKLVNIYDRHSGKFIDQMILPKEAKKFKLNENHLFIYKTLDENAPTLYKYSISLLMENQ